MKTCPQCRAQYDDYMRFCLQDGTPLIAGGGGLADSTEAVTEQWSPQNASEETLLNTEKPAARTQVISEGGKPGNKIFLSAIAAAAGLLLLGSVISGAFWLLNSQNSNPAVSSNRAETNPANDLTENPYGISGANATEKEENLSENANINSENSPTPAPTATLKPRETRTPEKTPAPEIKPTPSVEDVDEPAPKPTAERPSRTIAGGVLNGRATNLPKPAYPPAARAVNASGAVNVQVLIDEDGNVVRASAVSGHPLLKRAAVRAARGARFRPTLLSGQPVKVTGVIVYNFVP